MQRSFVPMLGMAREGWLPLTFLLAASSVVLSHGHPLVATFAVLGVALVAGFFQEPERNIPASALSVVSPVSGRVISIGDCSCSVLDRSALSVRIRVNPFGGYALRAPVEGVLREPPHASSGRCSSWVRTDEGEDIALCITCGTMLGQRPLGYGYGQRVGHGRRSGARRFALEVELLLPAASRLAVKAGDRVTSGESIIVHLPSRSV